MKPQIDLKLYILVNLQKLKDETSVLKLLSPMGMTNSEQHVTF